jgi:hypothetical protein
MRLFLFVLFINRCSLQFNDILPDLLTVKCEMFSQRWTSGLRSSVTRRCVAESDDECCSAWPFKMTAIAFIRNVGTYSTKKCNIPEEWSYCRQVRIRQKYMIIFILCEEMELKDSSLLISLYWAPQMSLDVAARVGLLRDKAVWRSGDRASWYIRIIKPTRCANFSNLFLE